MDDLSKAELTAEQQEVLREIAAERVPLLNILDPATDHLMTLGLASPTWDGWRITAQGRAWLEDTPPDAACEEAE